MYFLHKKKEKEGRFGRNFREKIARNMLNSSNPLNYNVFFAQKKGERGTFWA